MASQTVRRPTFVGRLYSTAELSTGAYYTQMTSSFDDQ